MKALRVYWLVPTVLFLGSVGVLFDQESGLPAWADLKQEFADSQGRVQVLQERVSILRSEIRSLEEDPFAQERAIREELKLARPGEVLVEFPPNGNSQRDF